MLADLIDQVRAGGLTEIGDAASEQGEVRVL